MHELATYATLIAADLNNFILSRLEHLDHHSCSGRWHTPIAALACVLCVAAHLSANSHAGGSVCATEHAFPCTPLHKHMQECTPLLIW